MFIHIRHMVLAVCLAVLFNSSCTRAVHGYRPEVRPLEDQHLENIPRGKCTVAVINVTESREVRMTSWWFWIEMFTVYTDLKDWGDDICGTLKNALERLGYITSDSGEKVIEIRVTRTFAHYRWGFSKHRVSLKVELGGRYNLRTEVIKHSGWNWKRAAYGSVMDAAYWILHNETVQRYLRQGQDGEGRYK